jgi:hypothetical protein
MRTSVLQRHSLTIQTVVSGLFMIGTDALESLFGKVRTMVGADTNADHLQLANRIESAAICSQILAEITSWERAPRRLTLRSR